LNRANGLERMVLGEVPQILGIGACGQKMHWSGSPTANPTARTLEGEHDQAAEILVLSMAIHG
jgi:hypothetical protein